MNNALVVVVLATIVALLCGSGQAQKKACIVKSKRYFEGEQFIFNINERCSFNCTCTIKRNRGIGNCTKNCAEIIVPSDCEPTRDFCGCTTGYRCPETNCQDSQTKKTYKKGQTWSNSTCKCLCLGNSISDYQCLCTEPEIPEPVTNEPELRPTTFPRAPNCELNQNVSCKVCLPSAEGKIDCSRKQKCEMWTLNLTDKETNRTNSFTCTCYGPNNYSKCIPILNRGKRSAAPMLIPTLSFRSFTVYTVIPAIRIEKRIEVPIA